MLQDYRRTTKIKLFAPKFKDQCSKQWNSDSSIITNLSLLSISSLSKNSADQDTDDEIQIDQYANGRESSCSGVSPSVVLDELEQHKIKHINLDPYVLNKHLNGIPSTTSKLTHDDIDKSVSDLLNDDKSSYQWEDNDYNSNLIRSPPFSQHIKQIKDARSKLKQKSPRTTKTEQKNKNQTKLRRVTSIPPSKSPTRQSLLPSYNRLSRARANSTCSFRQTESARSCQMALSSSVPLTISAMLVKQMRQDIQSNRVPAYSKPLNSALLREQPNPPFTFQFKMQRVHQWLEKLVPTDYSEYNEHASHESTVGTNFNDKLDNDSDLLIDEKRSNHIERTYEEAHRALPLFKSEIYRKTRHHNLLLNRLQLDLYVI